MHVVSVAVNDSKSSPLYCFESVNLYVFVMVFRLNRFKIENLYY